MLEVDCFLIIVIILLSSMDSDSILTVDNYKNNIQKDNASFARIKLIYYLVYNNNQNETGLVANCKLHIS